MTYLLDHLPSNLHVVIATRADPPLQLGRLRAHGQMLELRTQDLRFTSPETTQFLNEVMRLGLSTEDIEALEARTEGWVVGLQMAALSLKGHENASQFIRAFSGSHRYVLDYLVEEVLKRQPAHIQTFLLETSVLEKLNGSLCDALVKEEWKEAGESGQAVLEYLERSNLFVIPMDESKQWYRYHQLFADLLRARLDQIYPGLSPHLHAHAAVWFEDEGMTVEAVNHNLAAGEYDRAARLVEENTTRLLAKDELNALMSLIEALPAELRLARPRLCVHQAYVLTLGGRLAEVPLLLAQAEAAQDAAHQAGEEAESLSPAEGRSLSGAIAAIRAMVATLSGQNAEAISLARHARELLPASNLWDRAAAAWALGYALHSQGHLSEAHSAFEEQIQLGRAMSNTATLMIGLADLAWVLRDQGEIRQARALLEEALAEASQKGRAGLYRSHRASGQHAL
jgi:LuxR family maltose regulon positive regulatory protein